MARILVVDDDADSLGALRKFLETRGHAVESASNGRHALTQVLLNAPDLIILDLVMPQLDGVTLLGIMRSYVRLKSLPVIVLTALTESPMIDQARSLNVNSILAKGKTTLEEIAQAARLELERIGK